MKSNDTTRVRRAARALLCLAAAPLLMGGKCDRSLVTDSGFDLWCGDALCAWKVDAGSVAKVPTWHERDYGVALLGDRAAISQLLSVGSDEVSCITFDLLADTAGADVVLALDFDDDGSDEHTEVIPGNVWTRVQYRIVAPTYFHSVRISVRKQGAGRTVLAQIEVDSTAGCSGDPPIGRLDRPLGASCETTDQCDRGQGLCLPRTSNGELFADPNSTSMACGSCSSDGDCDPGAVCGLGWSPDFILPYRGCAPAAAAVVGDRCLVDAECAGGVCCDGVCSTCCDRDAGPMCTTGASCLARARGDDGKPVRTDWECAPDGGGGVAAGMPCLHSDDCISRRCVAGATLSVCGADGRRCASNADCPRGSSGNPCIAIGVAGGICQ